MKRRPAISVVAALALAVASCGVEVGRRPLKTGTGTIPSKTSNGGDVVGGETATTTTAPVTTTTEARPPDVEITGDDGSPANATVANAIADLQEWWGTEFPRLYDGKAYAPVSGGFYAIDHNASLTDLPCAPDDASQVLGNAYYCPPSDAVVWDQEQLMPELARDFGDFAPAVVIAHEWGHAIQARAEFDQPTVIFELQADCFAGAWVRHVRDGDARFSITTDDLDQALAGFLSLRDAPGSTADDPNAHGSGFDRVRSFQEGFEDGLDRCAEYRNGDPKPFQFPFSDASEVDSGGDLPLRTASNDGILDLIPGSLDAYWTKTFPVISDGTAWDPLGPLVPFTADDPPDCGGEPVSAFDLFVCVPDRYVGYVKDPILGDVYDQGGDFAVATLIATKYGVDAESQLGDLPDDVTTGLRGDCYAGSWAASILPDPATDRGDQTVTLSPGDLDEAVGVLLSFRTQGERDSQGPGFDRVRAFRIGVIDGARACDEVKPS